MPLVSTPAVILSTLRYGETSKIVRLATREHGVQSAIAKGALRPKSRFGASLQPLSDGVAHLILSDRRDLHIMTAFDLRRLRVDLAADVGRYATASVLAELMIRVAATEPHPESYEVLREGLDGLLAGTAGDREATALRTVWLLVSSLGFAPALEQCAEDGEELPEEGELCFGLSEGGGLCPRCAVGREVIRLPADARRALVALVRSEAPMPSMDARNAAAHRRLLGRYIRHHLAESAALPALEYWQQQAWG
jgi:DNA repair protein RecO (recombination protein O)